MTLESILRGAVTVAGALVPGVAAAAQIVNAFLPRDKQLNPRVSTGQDVIDAYTTLSPTQQIAVDNSLTVELASIAASTDKLQAMVAVETATANTRPFIAKMMAWAVFLAVMFMMLMWGRAVWVSDAQALKQLADSWPLMLAILATPTALLRAYFGMRTAEKKARYAAATGQPIASAIGELMAIFRKKEQESQ